MSTQPEHLIYEKIHTISITNENDITPERKISVSISEVNNDLLLKIKDVDDYCFNYIKKIDWNVFEKLKTEQCLDIDFGEFKTQLIELLGRTSAKEVMLRTEANDSKCRICFYEKSKLKALVLLTIELDTVNQRDIIEEMFNNIVTLKDENNTLKGQCKALKKYLNQKDAQLKDLNVEISNIQNKFLQDMRTIEQELDLKCHTFERLLNCKLLDLTAKLNRATRDFHTVKMENQLKCESSARLVQSMQNLRLETEKNYQTIEELKRENCNLNRLRENAERFSYDLKLEISKKESEIDLLQKQIHELHKDLQQATLIISQKNKANDEIAKDLVQANLMLVNFNNHYDRMAQEADEIKEQLKQKEQIINEQNLSMQKLHVDFEAYKTQFNCDSFSKLNNELLMANQRVRELEKANREMQQLNGVLTRKLSCGAMIQNGV